MLVYHAVTSDLEIPHLEKILLWSQAQYIETYGWGEEGV